MSKSRLSRIVSRPAALVLILLLTSCAAVPLHPGAINKFDSQSFDVLLTAQAVIEQARTESASGQLPLELKPGLNRLVESYNVGLAGWITYRAAMKAGRPADAGAVKQQIDTIKALTLAFQAERPIP